MNKPLKSINARMLSFIRSVKFAYNDKSCSVHGNVIRTLRTLRTLVVTTLLRRFDSFEAKSLNLRNTFFRSYLVNTRQNEAIFI